MANFLDLLNQLNAQETSKVEVPMAPQATMPEDLNQLAQEEAIEQAAPARAPALGSNQEKPINRGPAAISPELSTESMTKTRTMTSGPMIPESDVANGSETAEARLERLMRELQDQRNKEREEAASRQFKGEIAQSITKGLGGVLAGSQAMNTKASVKPTETGTINVGDLVGQVDKKFAGDREALMDQYKQLLNARDRSEQRKYQQEQLNLTKEGLRLKEKALDKKSSKLSETLTPGEKRADETFAKDFNNLTSKGFNNAETAISRIEKVAEELENEGDGYLSAGAGRTSILPDSFRQRDSIRWRDAAQNEANATLKELFPGSLSDDERRAAAKEYYNDQLSNAENAKILKAKAAQLRRSVADQRQKAEYFAQHGTLKGLGLTGGGPETSKNTIRIQGPSGQIAEVSAEKAEKYLSKPGYKKVD